MLRADGGQSAGDRPTTSDAPAILKKTVGSASACDLGSCICDVSGDSHVTASDALLTLRVAVGQAGALPRLREALGNDRFEAAVAQGAAITLTDAVAYADRN